MGRTKITFPKKGKVAAAAVATEDSAVDATSAGGAVELPPASIVDESTKVGKKTRKRRRVKQGVKALREIKKYQTTTEPVLLKAPFQRVCREISEKFHTEGLRFQKSAMAALQVGAEEYLTDLYADAYNYVTLNTSRRKTLSAKDMKTVLALRRREGASNSSAPITY
jgi:histone H3/H4